MKRLFSILAKVRNRMVVLFHDEYTIAEYFRKVEGVRIGSKCRIIGRRLHMFGGEPYLVEIGDDVTIAEDVKFITHDGGTGVLRKGNPGLNVFGRIVIHDNCFVGANSILMPNITIGPNSVVGAGSVVTRDVPPDTVAAGVPARVIMPLEEYRRKALSKGMILHAKDPDSKKVEVMRHVNNGL
jgi:acetyltransferase-like isoleucine patch superfamily enzyme